MYHPRLRSVHSPLTPIPPMSQQTSFDFSPTAINRCLEASKSTAPSVLKPRRSYTPSFLELSPPDISPIEYISNSTNRILVSPNPTIGCNNSLSKGGEQILCELDSDQQDSFNCSNINNRHLNISSVLDEIGLKEYKTLFEAEEWFNKITITKLQTMAECMNVKIGSEFLHKFNWPMDLADGRFDRCYCDKCYPSGYKDNYTVGGGIYVIPRNYTRFGLKIDETYARHLNIWKDWLNCLHGTSINAAKSIVEHRMLLLPGEQTMQGENIKIRPGHLVGQQFFFTTPSINYAGLPNYASCYEFKSINGKCYNITVALQCKQKPGSFTIQRETVGARTNTICRFIDNTQIEWKSQQRASIIPYGLLLHVEYVKSGLDGVRRRCSTLFGGKAIPFHVQVDWMQVECPNCYHTQDWINPRSNQGQTLECEACKEKFNSFVCTHCDDSCFVYSGVYGYNCVVVYKCRNAKCNKGVMINKCLDCGGINFNKATDNKNQTTAVTCINGTCKKKTYLVSSCPHCGEMKQRKDLVGKNGTVAKCSAAQCLRQYQLVECPKCNNVSSYPNAYSKVGRDDLVTCAYQKCGVIFPQPLQQRNRKPKTAPTVLPTNVPKESIELTNVEKLMKKAANKELNRTM